MRIRVAPDSPRAEVAAAVAVAVLATAAVGWAVRGSFLTVAAAPPAHSQPRPQPTAAAPAPKPAPAVRTAPPPPSASALTAQAAALRLALANLPPAQQIVLGDLARASSDKVLASGAAAGSASAATDLHAVAADLAAARHDTATLSNLAAYAQTLAQALSTGYRRWQDAHPGATPTWALSVQQSLAAAGQAVATANAQAKSDLATIAYDERGWLGSTHASLPSIGP